jgi:hypothetical protein
MKLLIALSLFASLAMANENDRTHTPRSFAVSGGKAVFADFSEAVYNITYDLNAQKASVVAEIKLETRESGFPIFDSVATPTSVVFDGAAVTAVETKTPNRETTLRYVNKLTSPGVHTLKVEVPLTSLVKFAANGVSSAFWTSDLSERQFLERYLPANFEFDQVKMTFNVSFIGAKTQQLIYTNGVVTSLKSNVYKISYPSYYTASSVYFHVVPQGTVKELRFSLKSIDGRNIPSVVYFSTSSFGGNLERLKSKTTEVFHELESDYGPFPHPSITVLQAGSGGMEYCGATMTDFSALGHELFHSYFARGVMPANGNSGWLDEALASWRDDGYQTLDTLSGSTGMSSHPYYTRITDTQAYSFGERFMSYLDGKTKAKGGLKPFMRYMVDKKSFAPLFVEEFIKEMNQFYGISVDEDFKRYTFSKSTFAPTKKSSHVHKKMTVEEMENLL